MIRLSRWRRHKVGQRAGDKPPGYKEPQEAGDKPPRYINTGELRRWEFPLAGLRQRPAQLVGIDGNFGKRRDVLLDEIICRTGEARHAD